MQTTRSVTQRVRGSHDNPGIVLQLCSTLVQSVISSALKLWRIFKHITVSFFDVGQISFLSLLLLWSDLRITPVVPYKQHTKQTRASVCVYVRVRPLWYGSRTRLWCKHRGGGKQTRLHCYYPVCIISLMNCSHQRKCPLKCSLLLFKSWLY